MKRAKRALALCLFLAGCAAKAVTPPAWDSDSPLLLRLFEERKDSTQRCAILAQASYTGPPADRTFTLEIFYRAPDTYLLRGRGTLGVEGFRALVVGDSLTLLLDRQERGYQGRVANYPDSTTREMWQLIHLALPWTCGQGLFSTQPHQIRTAQEGTRPAEVRLERQGAVLKVSYGRYRSEYPFWHLRMLEGERDSARIGLEIRQQLYNTELPGSLFELSLPPGTQPLVD